MKVTQRFDRSGHFIIILSYNHTDIARSPPKKTVSLLNCSLWLPLAKTKPNSLKKFNFLGRGGQSSTGFKKMWLI